MLLMKTIIKKINTFISNTYNKVQIIPFLILKIVSKSLNIIELIMVNLMSLLTTLIK